VNNITAKPKPMTLDPRIRAILLAHCDAIFATSVEESNNAIEKRNRLVWDLPAEQRRYLDVIARGFGRAFDNLPEKAG